MSKHQKVLSVLCCMIIFYAVAPISGVYAQTEGPFGDPTCSDFIDNDGDGKKDSADTDCYNNIGDPDVDDDGDGFTENEGDCNDEDDTFYPFAPKLCDAQDNDCDGKKDFTTDEDKDGDGVPWCANDCDDTNPNRAPNIIEAPIGSPICLDGIDNDCDNRIDIIDQGCQVSCLDSDGDGYGVNGDASCPVPGLVDCNDSDATINPGVIDDSCDGINNDCDLDGSTDEDYQIDNTCGVGECNRLNVPSSCVNGSETLCVAGDPAPEGVSGSASCTDTVDNDCDGNTDIADAACQTSCEDFDEDGYGVLPDLSQCAASTTVADCDDSNAARNPGGDDANCNGIDEDCAGGPDSGYIVDDSCGVGQCNTNNIDSSCVGGVETLCQSGDPVSENDPGGVVCTDGVDNDCDGLTDAADTEGCSSLDTDDDGDGMTENEGDCNDADPTIYLGAPKLCDALDNDCDGKKDFTTDEDKDGDGVAWCANDCDDNDGDRAPNITEAPIGSPICMDGKDNDCDNRVDSVDQGCQVSCLDSDGDGYGVNGDASCPVPGLVDCNDSDATINPGAADDSCDGINNDCDLDGATDEDYQIDNTCGVGECNRLNTPSSCVNGTETLCVAGDPAPEGVSGSASCTDTVDNDCDGNTDNADAACQTSCEDFDEDGYGVLPDLSQCAVSTTVADCDDSNAARNPGGDDANCNGIDEDCAGGPDSGYIVDDSCGVGQCNTNNIDSSCVGGVETLCQPADPVAEDTPGVGVCLDGVDNDCDGLTDASDTEGCSSLDIDDDGDGLTENQGDCNDADATIYPGAPKLCDALDNNCDGKKDFTTDEDKDGDGVPWCADDCDDNNANRSPDLIEAVFGSDICTDGIDNDCDNRVDLVDIPCQSDCVDNDQDGYGEFGDPTCPNGAVPDCNDSDASVNPGAADAICNGIDNNCSGTADDEYVIDDSCGVGECNTNNIDSSCVNGTETLCQPGSPVFEGPQGDGTCSGGLDEDCDTLIDGNDPGCNTDCIDQDGDGYGLNGGSNCGVPGISDCDDSDASVNPGETDNSCNGIDNNCSGTADDQYAVDNSCGVGQCNTNNIDSSCVGGVETACQPGDPVSENDPGGSVCTDGVDNDCDGLIDLEAGNSDPDCSVEDIDNDGDGYCAGASCTDGSLPNDCDDTDEYVYPGAPILCDGKDTDCSGAKDFTTDEDKDGDGVPWCEHWQTGLSDCDDLDEFAYPGNTEGPFDDASCFDGRDNDCQNGADAGDPACLAPSCDTKINPKNGPHVENLLTSLGPDNLPNTADDVIHPDNNSLLCGKCHGATFQDPIRYACDRCHTEGGTTKAAYSGTWPLGFESAPNVQMHSSTVVGTKYGAWDLECVTCHNPHLQEQNAAYGTSYGKLVKEYVCFDNPVTGLNIEELVEFTAPTGAGSFADGPPHTENICNMCHTQTNHHQRDGTAPGGQDHNNGVNCTQCHPHDDGFKPTGGVPQPPHDAQEFLNNCDYCHIDPGTGIDFALVIPDAKCEQCHTQGGALAGSFPTAPNVVTHADFNGSGNYVYNNACVECHNPMFAEPNIKLIRGMISNSIVPDSMINFTTRLGAGSFADGVPYNENICETCHSNTNHHQSDGTAPGGQDHNNGTTCTACHPHEDGFLPTGGEPAPPHDVITDCALCHSGPNFSDPVPSSACNTCHTATGVNKGGYPTAPDVVTHQTKECTECHNPMFGSTNQKLIRTQIASSIVPGSTITFTAFSGPNSFGNGAPYPENICDTCHSATNHHQSDGTAPGGQEHENGSDCRVCHNHNDAAGAWNPPAIVPAFPHNTITDCNLCHVGGRFSNPIPNSQCENCHTPSGAAKGSYPTAPDVVTHQGRNCVECHDPMYASTTNQKLIREQIGGSIVPGSNIVFTSFSGPGSFADGAPYNENICETCHSATNHHQSDGTAPGGQDHENSSDCRTCHDHNDPAGAWNPPNIIAVAPHNVITDCGLCHTGTNFADPVLNTACESCHTAAGVNKGSYPTAPDVATHQGRNCIECHNPMFGSTNQKLIRTAIASSIVPGSTIAFTTLSGPGSFADGPPYNENICETCHSATNHHQSDGTAPGGQDHNNETNCTTSCHPHLDSFAPTGGTPAVPHNVITDCALCHTEPNFSDPVLNTACANCHTPLGANKGSYPTAPDVFTHQGKDCVECHNPMFGSTNQKLIRTQIASSIVPGSNILFMTFSGPASFADGPPYNENICETCHSATNHHQSDGTAPGGQDHENGNDCRTCHDHNDPAGAWNPPNIVAVAPHNVITDCGLCHIGPNFSDSIPNTACESCHTPAGVNKGSYPAAPDVATHQSKDCVECHDPMFGSTNQKVIRTQIASSIIPGSTIVFTALSGPGSFADGPPYNENICETCHSATNHHQSDGTAPGGQDHNNETNCTTECHPHLDSFLPTGGVPEPPHDVISDCFICHVGPNFSDPVPNTACGNCHTAGGAEKPNYPTAPDVATHQGKDCVECHDPMFGSTNLKLVRTQITSSIVPGSTIMFTAFTGPGSFADGAPYNENICETCHSATNHHQSDGTAPGGQDHNNGVDCTICHEHLESFEPSGECIICHAEPQGNRVAVADQLLNGNSHHIQGVQLTNQHCYQCHWEANSDGSINDTYHGGWNAPGSEVNLVIYGGSVRPTSYNPGTTAVEYTAGGSGGGSPPFNQLDEFNGVTHETKVTSNPGATNWTAVSGSDGKNAWCYGTQATDSSNTGTNPGNPVPFIFVESSGAGTSTCGDGIALGSSQYLESNTLDAGTYAFNFSFDYNMQIGGNGSLHLDAYNGSGWDLDVTGGTIASGTQGTSWQTAGPYDLSSYSNADFKLRIRFVVSSTGNDYQNDLLLDNLAVTAGSGGSTRTELEKINQVCLGCHDADSAAAQPFGDGNTPITYAWDGLSIDERYSQAGTTTWGKYTGEANAAQKNIQKAYSAHGNAGSNVQGFSTSTGVDGTIPNRTGSGNILCIDCHNAHGSTASGTTTYYTSATANGGLLKDVTAGLGGSAATYKPADFAGSSTFVAHSSGSGLCFDCHMTPNADATIPWGYSTFGANDMIISYWEKVGWEGGPGINSAGPQIRYPFKDAIGVLGGHFGASSPLASTPGDTVDGLCAACHDPHGVSPSLGANQQYSVPMLKGTWLTSPYKEDTAPTITNEVRGGGRREDPVYIGSPPTYNIDQNTFRTATNSQRHTFTRYDVGASGSGDRIMQAATEFGGLCLSCHDKSQIDPDTNNTWGTYDRIHDSVLGWASGSGNNANNKMHGYSCSKCHTPHSSCLPRLAITNCLDENHRGQVVSGGSWSSAAITEGGDPPTDTKGGGRGRGPMGGGGYGEEPDPWGKDSGGAYHWGSPGTQNNVYPAYPTCHDTQTGTWTDQHWNNVTQW